MFAGLVAFVVVLSVAVAFRMVTRLADRPESAVPLGVFRIVYGLVLFCEVAQLLYVAPLIQDPVPFLVRGETHLTYLLVAWLVAVVFLILGLYTRTAAIVSYVATLCSISTFNAFAYHVDYVLIGTNLLMAVSPVGRRLSLDHLRCRLAAAATGQPEPPVEVSALYRKLFVFVGIALVYFDSVFWKFDSRMWLEGLGVWLPASQPPITWADYSLLLDREWVVRTLGYLTLALESAFIFLMWFDAVALPLAIVGVGLHLGITAVFPIPWFGLAVAAIYPLVLPAGIYAWIGRRLRYDRPRLTFYYDEECSLCARTRIAVEHFDVRRAIAFRDARAAERPPALRDVPRAALLANAYSVDDSGAVAHGYGTYRRVASLVVPFVPAAALLAVPGLRGAGVPHASTPRRAGAGAVYARPAWRPPGSAARLGLGLLIGAIVFSQAVAIARSPVFTRLVGLPLAARVAGFASSFPTSLAAPLMGLVPHAVFMHTHFVGYEHVLAVVYAGPSGRDEWLPLVRPNGHAHWMNSGRVWVNWTWRCMGPQVNPKQLDQCLKRTTAFWLHRQGIPPRNATFRILVKKVEVPSRWERGFLHRQQEQPWIEAGTATWKNGAFKSTIANVEGL